MKLLKRNACAWWIKLKSILKALGIPLAVLVAPPLIFWLAEKIPSPSLLTLVGAAVGAIAYWVVLFFGLDNPKKYMKAILLPIVLFGILSSASAFKIKLDSIPADMVFGYYFIAGGGCLILILLKLIEIGHGEE